MWAAESDVRTFAFSGSVKPKLKIFYAVNFQKQAPLAPYSTRSPGKKINFELMSCEVEVLAKKCDAEAIHLIFNIVRFQRNMQIFSRERVGSLLVICVGICTALF